MTAVADRPLFGPRGRISIRAACIEVIRRIEPKEGITLEQLADDVEELTGIRVEAATLRSSMWQASQDLLDGGELGMDAIPGVGWQRQDDSAAVRGARAYASKAVRQVRRSAASAGAADPERLGWQDRESRDHALRTAERLAQLGLTRGRRQRPLPPADS